jgi:hypothetical protein
MTEKTVNNKMKHDITLINRLSHAVEKCLKENPDAKQVSFELSDEYSSAECKTTRNGVIHSFYFSVDFK